MDKREPETAVKERRAYEPPKVESEAIFERNALACGKCRSGPHKQHACMRLMSVS